MQIRLECVQASVCNAKHMSGRAKQNILPTNGNEHGSIASIKNRDKSATQPGSWWMHALSSSAAQDALTCLCSTEACS